MSIMSIASATAERTLGPLCVNISHEISTMRTAFSNSILNKRDCACPCLCPCAYFKGFRDCIFNSYPTFGATYAHFG